MVIVFPLNFDPLGVHDIVGFIIWIAISNTGFESGHEHSSHWHNARVGSRGGFIDAGADSRLESEARQESERVMYQPKIWEEIRLRLKRKVHVIKNTLLDHQSMLTLQVPPEIVLP